MAQHGKKEIVNVAIEKSVHERLVKLQLQLGVDYGHRLSLSDVVEALLGSLESAKKKVR